MLLLFLILRRERVEKALVLPRSEQASLDPQPIHRAGKAKAIHQHTDRSEDAGLVHINLIGRSRHVVAARGTDVFNHYVQRNLRVLGAQTPNLVINDARLDRTAPWAVDAQDNPSRPFILKC